MVFWKMSTCKRFQHTGDPNIQRDGQESVAAMIYQALELAPALGFHQVDSIHKASTVLPFE
jgi:hypothetical protein